MPGRISDEVGQSTLQEACIYSTGRIAVNMQLKVSILYRCLVQFRHRIHNAGQAVYALSAGLCPTVSLRQKQHVLHDHRHSLQIFEVIPQHVSQRLDIACFAQSDLCASHQCCQRREQFVRDVGVERFKLLIGLM